MIMELSVRWTTIAVFIIAPPNASVPPTIATAIWLAIASGAIIFAHFDVHHFATRQFLAGNFLNRLDVFLVTLAGKHEGRAATTSTASTTDAVDIIVGVNRDVEIKNMT